jgi:hypothetical protein
MKSMSHEAGPVAPKVSTFTGPMWAHLLLLVILATAITYPCIHRGFPLGHSTFTHINYQHFFDGEIAQGDWYPRWIINMNRGLGSGVFFAQYPLPYYVAWVAGKIVPNHWGSYLEARTLGLSLALAAILAALFTYAWCACFTDRLTAMLAAIIYLGLPYFLTVDVYMRVALGEFFLLHRANGGGFASCHPGLGVGICPHHCFPPVHRRFADSGFAFVLRMAGRTRAACARCRPNAQWISPCNGPGGGLHPTVFVSSPLFAPR